MNTSYNSSTLSRAQTPNSTLSTATRPSPSPKCFGRTTHILKEEYERERVRWQQKLEEVEQKLTEASINNSELFQIKAELNRKIIDFEKNQRPLIEQNRRLNDRIRSLNAELKKLEEKLSYAQDDFLSLRDAYDRLVKENSTLKEQRAFPEKMEELGRYRSQVLEYSKCITALRQSAIEKDRRYEMLVQKFKKFRKCWNTKRSGNEVSEDDHQSCIGSEGSMDGSSICLDTIAEDLDEDMDLASTELFHVSMTPTEYSLKQQLDLANMTIVELQSAMENGSINGNTNTVDRLNEQITYLKKAKKDLEAELANTQHHNELLEFQLTELTEGSPLAKCSDFADKQCSTELELSVENDSSTINLEIRKRLNVSSEEATKAGEQLNALLHSSLLILRRDQVENLKYGIEVLDALQNQLTFTETELNMTNCELSRLKRQFDDEVTELKKQCEENSSMKLQKKKELQADIDQLKKEKKEESKKIAKQILELQTLLKEKTTEVTEKAEEIQKLNGDLKEMLIKNGKQSAQIVQNDGTISELRTQFETLAEDLSKARDDINSSKKRYDADLNESKVALEKTRRDSSEEIAALKTDNLKLKALKEAETAAKAALQNELNQLNNNLLEMKSKHTTEQTNLETHFRNSLQESLNEIEAERQIAEASNQKLQHELNEANEQIMELKRQIRPIGTQLERRYEESKYRLNEALKKIANLEKQLVDSNDKISALETTGTSTTSLTNEASNQQDKLKIKQLEAYNRELEEQFNSQMDIIAALKKKFIVMKGNTQSTDSIGWTSNSSEGTNSLDDEQYHSEGSDSGRAVINVK